MRIKIIESTSPKILEESTNAALAELESNEKRIIDIKYISVFDEVFYSETKTAGNSTYSAMIIYR